MLPFNCTIQCIDHAFIVSACTHGPHVQEDPLLETVELDETAAEGSDDDTPVPAPPATLGSQEVEAELYVKDAGMMLVSTVAPDFTWQSGNADIAIK